jgi:hypothetical protein
MLVWVNADEVHSNRFTPDGGWGAPDRVDSLGTETGGSTATTALVFDGEDFIAAFGQRDGNSATPLSVYTNRWHDGSWSEAERRSDGSVPMDASSLVLGVDGQRNVTVVWAADAAHDLEATFSRYAARSSEWGAPAPVGVANLRPAKLAVRTRGGLGLAYGPNIFLFE